ncbi:TonB-linked outer membrane protein, SusC/RagA family [Catalinimonas alkaloidigena]|uniref:TonB-linked outer membrane protein, SusC/RagA family n=1 Tax=Catalinimonas alkaloidigena TaxID=1075417 RepID=A0A1G8YG18_9BACT|nr:SusC/RagA family TonB-linked outer membrane protein [Catalinimonas alkaloidigena]SDK01768.1 TonB-linked outer membrane protein, SusC/RagA family [Catalinimonas alkaloidigena]
MKHTLPLLFWLLTVGALMAQERTVTGTVTLADDGSALPGVNVLVKGTPIGTITDLDGHYTLTVPGPDDRLIFSFIGFLSQELPVGNQSTLDVAMQTDTRQLNEVVVNALGFEEDADHLGSTSSKINGEALAKSGEAGLINSMAGRAAGVQVTRSAGDPGAGSYIQIRGQSTITGNSQPLIILDGIPISNTSEGSTSGGVVQQSRLNDINPNDIASMQILKGASAAALWGSRAANGVIVITTKKGQQNDKLNITYSSTYSFDQVNRFHPRQSAFGQGSGGAYSPTASTSWGDKIADRTGGEDVVKTDGEFFEGYATGTRYYPILEKNTQDLYTDSNYDKVFQTGRFWENSLSMSGGGEKSSFFFSLGDLKQNGVIRGNSDYRRTTIRFNSERKFNKIVKLSTQANYVRSTSDRVQRGNNTAGVIVGLLRNPPDFDVTDYIGSYYATPNASPLLNRQRSYRRYLGNNANPIYNNPLWAMYEQENSSAVDRFIVSSELNIKPVQWFDLTARGGVDFYTDERINDFPVGDVIGAANGQFENVITKETEKNFDLIGRVVKSFGNVVSSTLVGGFNINDRQYRNLGATINNFLIADGPQNFSNATATNKNPQNVYSHIRTTRLYSTLNLGLYSSVFLNLSGAAESASTFGENASKTFFYPSADVAWQFTDLAFLRSSPVLSFGKLRASYGVVGVQPLPYRTTTDFVTAEFSNSPWGDVLVGSQFGNGAFIQSKEQGDDQLKPERKTEYELGADLRFLNDKLAVAFTYYQNKVEDLLVPVTLAASTGFASKYTNAATLENKGVELDLSYSLLQTNHVRVTLNGNFNRNRNQVLDLAGTESIFLDGILDFMDSRAVEGQPVGVHWGGRYARNDDGSLVLDANGFPTVAPTSGVIGNPNPDWRGGFGGTIDYKQFSLNVLFETSQGGDIYSGTRSIMYNFGTHADVGKEITLSEPLVNYAGATFDAGTTVRGNIADYGAGPVLLDESFYTTLGSGFGSLKEQFIEDASWTRLRQVALSYHLASEGFQKKTKLHALDITATGRNLLLWTQVVGVDPETNLTGVSNGRGMDYFNTPGTRSYLLTLTITY